jgi:hypothetical protein
MGISINGAVMLKSWKTTLILPCLFSINIALCCEGLMGLTELGSPHATKLISNYNLVCDVSFCQIGRPAGDSSYSVYNTYGVIDVDWDSEFMVIKTRQPDETTLNWYIISIASGKLLGPFPYDEYLHERQTLSVSEEIHLLEFGDDFEIYRQKH